MDGRQGGTVESEREALELERAFGEPVSRVSDLNWAKLARRLSEYVENADRTPVLRYEAVRQALMERWGVPVVETPHVVGAMGPLGDADPDYGRCGVRLLDLLGVGKAFIVIRQAESSSGKRMLWALLHELGHFVRHFELLLSLSALYQRLCLVPSIEMDVGRLALRAAAALHVRHELEADVFALDWLLPPALDDEELLLAVNEVPDRLSADGYRFYLLRGALAEHFPLPADAAAIDLLNRLGEGERRRACGAYPHNGSLWRRASWAFFNRRDARAKDPSSTALLREYFDVAGYPPRYVPELTRRRLHSSAFDPSLIWLPRVSAASAIREVDAVHWRPMLVCDTADPPSYHIPIRPVPGRREDDRGLGWVSMVSSDIPKSRPLEDWLGRAGSAKAGLLIFPRNPAERALDAEGQVRE